jgi:hypothetical protein
MDAEQLKALLSQVNLDQVTVTPDGRLFIQNAGVSAALRQAGADMRGSVNDGCTNDGCGNEPNKDCTNRACG